MKTTETSSWPEPVTHCPNWETFEEEIKKLRARLPAYELCFRGQADANWGLTTTLERRTSIGTFSEYYRLVTRIADEVATFEDAPSAFPTYNEFAAFDRSLETYESLDHVLRMGGADFPLLNLWAFLRHYGFPSPLLDWSRSPFVAAFFAFQPAFQRDNVSIFAYSEMPEHVKHGGSDGPRIAPISFGVGPHKRHFNQQGVYTICAEYEMKEKVWRFQPHSLVLKADRSKYFDGLQDALWQFTIPASERLRVLTFLDDFNLNALSLYGSTEALLETIAFREFDRPI